VRNCNGEENWAGRGVVFFGAERGMNDGYPAGDDNLYGGCNGEGWLRSK
jgi:hypothetical protein